MLPKALGTHYIIDFYGCDAEALKNADICQNIFDQAALLGKFTVVASNYHEFKPWGVSGMTILSESHLSVHTWPEHEYAAIDLFFCGGEVYPDLAIQCLREHLNPVDVQIQCFNRGEPQYITKVSDA